MCAQTALSKRMLALVVFLVPLGILSVQGAESDASGPRIRSGPVTEEDGEFWSFRPFVRPAVPEVQGNDWCETSLDHFVLKELESVDLPVAGDVDPRTFIRRATFDLTGLPPTPEDVQRFLADTDPGAHSRLVDRLLASPHYGERWGRHWLDVARYADTAGETADYPVPLAWRYRNWVIDALNAGKPYDDFVREQIAGDLIAQGQDGEQFESLITATGYLAISRRFGFGIKDFHHVTIQDTLDTLGQSVLGLTIGCARCHDHKYDAIDMDDYYAWYGIFSSTHYAWTADEKTKKEREFIPTVPFDRAAQMDADREREKNEFTAKVGGLEKELKEIDEKLVGVLPDPLIGDMEGYPIAGQMDGPWDSRNGEISTEAQSPYTNVNPSGTRGLRTRNSAGNNGAGCKVAKHTKDTHKKVWFNLDFRNGPAKAEAPGAIRVYVGQGPGVSPAIEGFILKDSFIVKNGDAIETVCALEEGQWYNLQFELDLENRVYSGVIGHPDKVTAIEKKAVRPGWNGIVDVIFVDGHGYRFGVKPEQDWDNLTLRDKPLLPVDESVVFPVTADDGSSKVDIDALRKVQATKGRELAMVKKRIAALAHPFYDLAFGVREGKVADAPIHMRGDPETPGDTVSRRHFTVFGGEAISDPESSSGRLDLANWLTRDDNPLTARVMVNRLWQFHFGRGLVETPNDFGARGKPPSHPKLLDWLASEFVRSGWSLKHMHRLIMGSRVYRLASSVGTDATLSEEQEHERTRLFGRFARRHLEAEALRDSMLAISGQLDRSQGEAHPFPAPDAWAGYTQHNPFFAVYPTKRRSVYLMVQRMKSHPYLGLFDGADPSVSTGRRAKTTTPTQALYLMNNEFVHEQAQSLARRLLSEYPGEDGAANSTRVRRAFEECFAREPARSDLERSRSFLERYERGLVDTGSSASDARRGALAALLRTLLVRNEFLFLE